MAEWMDGWENRKTGSRSRRRRQDSCQNCLVYFGINLFMMPMVVVVSLLAFLSAIRNSLRKGRGTAGRMGDKE